MEKYKAESGRGLFQGRHGTGFYKKFRYCSLTNKCTFY